MDFLWILGVPVVASLTGIAPLAAAIATVAVPGIGVAVVLWDKFGPDEPG